MGILELDTHKNQLNMSDKEHYRKHCVVECTIPLFSQHWWLDAVCGEGNWDVVVVQRDGEILGSMPFYIKSKYGRKSIVQPPLTQTLGPWLRSTTAKYSKSLGQQKKILTSIIEQLPEYYMYNQLWHYTYTNWLPFYWKGFEQKTFYTYVLPNLNDTHKLWEEFESKIRTDIRKASNRFNIQVREDLGVDEFLELNKMTFARQGLKVPYSNELVWRIDSACKQRNCRKIWIAEDDLGQRHAGLYIVWDHNSAYYLMGGGNPNLRTSGATSLLMWEAIKHASTVTKRFDFEGSMIEPIERWLRGFGAIQVPYFNITHRKRHPVLNWERSLNIMKSLFRRN